MFDNHLIDGRILAQAWSLLKQPTQTQDDYDEKLNENIDNFATPLG
jgi:hypothetical protein